MSEPYYQDDHVRLYHGDCRMVLPGMEGESVHAVCTDPPYELGFMGKRWDASGIAYDVELWSECLRVLKPGGYLLAFGGTRTWHRLACAIEDAGFELRDSMAWLYGSGFPKSLDVSKSIDKAAGAEREIVGQRDRYLDGRVRQNLGDRNEVYGVGLTANGVAGITAPATTAAKQWEGWGTALKPAFEPIVVARKPLSGTVAATVLEHGTGALNIDACRVAYGEDAPSQQAWNAKGSGGAGSDHAGQFNEALRDAYARGDVPVPSGRWPTNVVLDESQAAELDRQSGVLASGANPTRRGSDKFRDAYGEFAGQEECIPARGADTGGASRFFPVFRYEAKADAAERPRVDGVAHPTVKPIALMRWLVRLVTPPGGTVLDPFAGSGTTLQAARAEGFDVIGIEREADYLPLIRERLERVGSPVNADDGGWPGPRKTEGQASMFDLLGGDAA
jgi:hypothetical protein